MMAVNPDHLIFGRNEAISNNNTLVPVKSKSTFFRNLNFHSLSQRIRQRFVTRLNYFVNCSSLHGIRFLDRQYGTIDRCVHCTENIEAEMCTDQILSAPFFSY